MKTESYLPVFTGYYHTIFSPDYDLGIYNLIESTGIESLDYDDIEWDMEEYKEEMGKACCKVIEEVLTGLFNPDANCNVIYQKTYSPRFYNFETDVIHCLYHYNNAFKNALRAYLEAHREAFDEYLRETYTSRDGFASWHSNEAEVWLGTYWEVLEEHGHYLGAMLEFVFQWEGFSQYDLREEITDVYIYGTVLPEIFQTKGNE